MDRLPLTRDRFGQLVDEGVDDDDRGSTGPRDATPLSRLRQIHGHRALTALAGSACKGAASSSTTETAVSKGVLEARSCFMRPVQRGLLITSAPRTMSSPIMEIVDLPARTVWMRNSGALSPRNWTLVENR